MTKSEFKAKFKLAIKNDDKPVIMEMMDPLIERLSVMINHGILIRNVKLRLIHSGITGEACEMLTEMAVIRAERFQHYKAR